MAALVGAAHRPYNPRPSLPSAHCRRCCRRCPHAAVAVAVVGYCYCRCRCPCCRLPCRCVWDRGRRCPMGKGGQRGEAVGPWGGHVGAAMAPIRAGSPPSGRRRPAVARRPSTRRWGPPPTAADAPSTVETHTRPPGGLTGARGPRPAVLGGRRRRGPARRPTTAAAEAGEGATAGGAQRLL